MKIILKTQVLDVSFSLFWLIYVNILVFFNQPGRILEYINWFVYGFAVLIGILVLLLTKRFFGGKWLVLPLVLVPEFILYQPILDQLFSGLVPEGYKVVFNFLSLSTGTVYLLANVLGVILGIMFGRVQKA